MKTATRALILASLFGAGCSGSAGDPPLNGSPTDPTTPVTPGVVPGQPSVTSPGPGVTPPGPGVTPPPGPGSPVTPPNASTTTPDTPTAPPPTGECKPGIPVTSQVPRLTNIQYDAVVRDVLGVSAPTGSWSESFEPDAVGQLANTQWSQYKSAADKIAAAVMATPLGQELTTAASDPTALATSIRTLGRKLMRRPLTDAEVTGFASLADVQPAGTPAEIAEAVVYAMLVAPSFLTRMEGDAPEEVVPGTEAAPQTAYKLTNYEVAARLSFLIWNSAPDDTLNAAADAGELQTPAQIAAQAERMLGEQYRDKITSTIAGAHRLWANIDETSSTSRWGKTTHDATRFPEYKESQTAALRAETDKFFAEVGYSGQFQDLFLSNVAYVNQDTAPLYGLTGTFGPELERVELDPTERPGFLTRADFLGSFAHVRDTSPILRGAFIITLMGGQTGAPNQDALNTPIPAGEYKTNREAVTALTSVSPDCVSCHETIINPPGFVLENFSAIGTVQTTDPEYGGPIDTKVPAVAFPAGPKPINNAHELMTEIAAGAKTKEIYAKKWVSYATGREANDFDQCTANIIVEKINGGSYPLSNVIADIVQADSFRLRTAAQ